MDSRKSCSLSRCECQSAFQCRLFCSVCSADLSVFSLPGTRCASLSMRCTISSILFIQDGRESSSSSSISCPHLTSPFLDLRTYPLTTHPLPSTSHPNLHTFFSLPATPPNHSTIPSSFRPSTHLVTPPSPSASAKGSDEAEHGTTSRTVAVERSSEMGKRDWMRRVIRV